MGPIKKENTDYLTVRGGHVHFAIAQGPMRKPKMLHALEDVDLSVQKGESFAIVGESGSGKSTLARLLVGLAPATKGTLSLDGKPFSPSSGAAGRRQVAQRIQMVFQDPSAALDPRMRIGDAIAEALKIHGKPCDSEVIGSWLQRVGLSPAHAHRYPRQLSGGQRQRANIARAISVGADILIGDEPVSALDVSVQAQILNLLADLRRDLGLTMIVISHDLGVVRHISDRVMVLYLGRVMETGPTGQVFSAPRHPYTRALLSATPVIGGNSATARDRARGDLPSPIDPPPGCRFSTRCPFAREKCSEVVPELHFVGEGQGVACHFAEELTATHNAPERKIPSLSPNFHRRHAILQNAWQAGESGLADRREDKKEFAK